MDDAVRFLQNPKVAGSGPDKKAAFLAKKGLPPEAVAAAAEKAGDAPLMVFMKEVLAKRKPNAGTSTPASTTTAAADPAAADEENKKEKEEGEEKSDVATSKPTAAGAHVDPNTMRSGEATAPRAPVSPGGGGGLPFGAPTAAADGGAPPAVVVPDVVITLAELAAMKGKGGARLCLACKGVVYEVDPEFYGEGRGYHAFAGVDCSRHLGKVKVGTQEANRRWDTLTAKQLKTLDEWEAKYQSKYKIVGRVDVEELGEGTTPADPAGASGGGGGGCATQ